MRKERARGGTRGSPRLVSHEKQKTGGGPVFHRGDGGGWIPHLVGRRAGNLESLVRVIVTHPLPPPGVELLRAAGHDVEVGPDSELAAGELGLLVAGADGILAHLADRIDGALLDTAGAQLRVVSNFAVGYDNVDVAAAAARGVRIGNTPDVLTGAVAELAVGLILGAARRIVDGDRFVREHAYVGWDAKPVPGFELRGRTIGIVGAGRIGSAVAHIAHDGFGMQVLYAGRSPKPELAESLGARQVELDELLRAAHVVVVTVPLSAQTRHLIAARELALMRPDAILVNVSRGPVVDEHALVEALRSGAPAAAGLDVYEFEPHPLPELLKLENVVLTPHIASATAETRSAMARLAAENLLAALDGRPMPAEVEPP
jgi:glyoxylate reductase